MTLLVFKIIKTSSWCFTMSSNFTLFFFFFFLLTSNNQSGTALFLDFPECSYCIMLNRNQLYQTDVVFAKICFEL